MLEFHSNKVYVFDTDLYSYLFLEPEGRMVNTGLENLDIQDSESLDLRNYKMNPAIWEEFLQRNAWLGQPWNGLLNNNS